MRVNRRQFLSSSAACASLGQARPPEARRPNVLLITDDQHNARNLGCYGDPLVRTPALDRLAGRGVRFNRAYTTNMICAPARVSMITGQYVHSHGYFGNSGNAVFLQHVFRDCPGVARGTACYEIDRIAVLQPCRRLLCDLLRPQRVLDRSRLFEYLLQHEVLLAALLRRLDAQVARMYLFRHFRAGLDVFHSD